MKRKPILLYNRHTYEYEDIITLQQIHPEKKANISLQQIHISVWVIEVWNCPEKFWNCQTFFQTFSWQILENVNTFMRLFLDFFVQAFGHSFCPGIVLFWKVPDMGLSWKSPANTPHQEVEKFRTFQDFGNVCWECCEKVPNVVSRT